jgi:hypothetical protein
MVLSARAAHQQTRSLVQSRRTVFTSTYCDIPKHVEQAKIWMSGIVTTIYFKKRQRYSIIHNMQWRL